MRQGAGRLPCRSALAGRVPGLRVLVVLRPRRAEAVAGLHGAGVPGAGELGPRGRVCDPLELFRVHDLPGVRSLRASYPG